MLVLFIGNIGSGKSLSADIICKHLNIPQTTFAEPLKNFALSIGFTQEEVYGTQEQKLKINNFWGISGREFLQKFGTEVCRDALPKIIPDMNMNNSQLWARVMEQKILQSQDLVISDGRFLDELELIKKYGGIIIKLERNTSYSSNHKSEQLNDLPYDLLITNNGTIEELKNKLLNIFIKHK